MKKLAAAPDNEAGWSYLRRLLTQRPEWWKPATRLAAAVLKACPTCLPALAFVAEAAVRCGRLGAASRLFLALRDLDPPRARYWTVQAALCLKGDGTVDSA